MSDTSDSDQSYVGDGATAGLTHESASQTETTSDSHEKSGKHADTVAIANIVLIVNCTMTLYLPHACTLLCL